MPYTTTTSQLVGAGGVPPYVFTAPASDPKTSLPGGTYSIVGSNTLQINASTISPGIYTLHIIITDSVLNSSDTVVNVLIVDPTLFTILNQDLNFEPASFPSIQSVPLQSNGGSGTVSWALLPLVTTLPGVTIDSSNNLNFTLSNYGTWTVGIQATDSLNNTTSTVLQLSAVSSQVYQLVDGQVEILVTAPAKKSGINQFTLNVTDATSTAVNQSFNYKTDEPISTIYIDDAFFDHYWGGGDTTSVVIPISGNLSGYNISSQTTTLSNGLVLTVDGSNNVVKVTGPPTTFANAQTYIQLPVLQGNNQVATITREYTLLSHNSSTSDIGALQCFTRPYIVGDFVGLNPLKPWVNSPTMSTSSTVYARVQTGSSLPPGLSLDANTTLIYGTLAGIALSQSVIEYVDATGVIHGTAVIIWDTQQGSFSLQDNITDGSVQQVYSGTINSSSSVPVTTASVYRGRLPQGLTIAPDPSGTFVSISGTPTESGYFDLWFKVTNQNSQSGYLYHRLVIDYINPLVILTSSLPTAVTGQPYNGSGFVMQGYGGVTPYTWGLDAASPALPLGLSLNSAGLLSGTPTASSYNQNIIIDLTDSRGVTVTAILNLAINNSVVITTPSLPKISEGQAYSFAMTAIGGVPPYTWTLPGSPALPSGISFSSSGVFSGVTVSNYSSSIAINATDTIGGSGHTATNIYLLQTGASSNMLIDTSGVGLVDRGAPYQGLLSVYGTFTSPVSWQVSPSSPNALPSGLTLQANSADSGVTAYIAGSSTASLSGYSVEITAVDSAGNYAQAFVLLTTTSSLAITTTSLPAGVVTGSYSAQLAATGYNPPFTWSIASGSLPSGYSLSSSGLISGITGATYNSNITFKVTDNLGDTYPLAPLAEEAINLTVQSSTLTITTSALTPGTAGRAYSMLLAATGGTPPYTWSISPSSAHQLPSGLSLNTSTGAITGTTTVLTPLPSPTNPTGGLAITFRVTDNVGAYSEKTLKLVIASGLVLETGIDYTDGTSTNYLGYIDAGSVTSINPRPNYSFYVIATGVATTSPTLLKSGIIISNPGFSVANVSISVGGVAYISITGPFGSGSVGDNTFGITVTDSGVSVTGTFKWKVYNDGALVVQATNAFPQQISGA